jgi:pimeloyl-ACP methyl ester carboxylesterase
MMGRIVLPLALFILSLCDVSIASEPTVPPIIVNGKDVSKIELNEEEVRFESGNFSLAGVLAKPNTPGPYPVIIFNHGDSAGLIDRYSRGFYRIIWERFNQIGYACLSWDTPGAGESTGTHDFSDLFNERTSIVLSAIDYLKGRADIDKGRIGLLGHSQAGYVMPLVVLKSNDVSFMINLSGPAMNSVEQGAFLIESGLLDNGFSRREANKYREYYIKALYAKTYEEYLKYAKPLNEQGCIDFVSQEDFQPYASDDQWYYTPSTSLESITIPVLAIFGDRDRNIDAIEDAKLYEKSLAKAKNKNYQVKVFHNADHSLFESETGTIPEVRRRRADGQLRFVPEALDLMCEWLSDLK